jgi:hypothetical protein
MNDDTLIPFGASSEAEFETRTKWGQTQLGMKLKPVVFARHLLILDRSSQSIYKKCTR